MAGDEHIRGVEDMAGLGVDVLVDSEESALLPFPQDLVPI